MQPLSLNCFFKCCKFIFGAYVRNILKRTRETPFLCLTFFSFLRNIHSSLNMLQSNVNRLNIDFVPVSVSHWFSNVKLVLLCALQTIIRMYSGNLALCKRKSYQKKPTSLSMIFWAHFIN